MPAKYVIHSTPAAPRLRPVGKLGIVDWREDCSSCHNCVKRACVYGLYRDEADTLREETGYLDYIYRCKGCLNCVQNCTKNILTRVVNPEYRRLGDAYYTPDIIVSTWFQAETGRIPVSGSGYGGPFSGPGFDSMWTDMSEIVRPTRDGIHGREYISTSVDIGRKLPYLTLADGQLSSTPPPLVETPLPVVLDSHGLEAPGPGDGNGWRPRHARDVLRDVHGTLVKEGIRDEVTVIASGGIAVAEHVAKAIICGADLVAIEVPLVLALECRLCGECRRGQLCPIALEEIDAQFGSRRIVNLMAAWHQQLIEVLGAMGIREIRRLRGETGRAMFFEDLERETFGRLFGKRKS